MGRVILSSTEENINESIIVNMKSEFFDLIQQTENDFWVVPKKSVTLDQRYYNLCIEAHYSNHSWLSSVKNVSVATNSFHSSSNPVGFSQTIYFAKIKDIVQIGTPLIQVRIEGEEKNYIFKFANDTSDIFSVHPETGWVTTGSKFGCNAIGEFRRTILAIRRGNPNSTRMLSALVVIVVGRSGGTPLGFDLPFERIKFHNDNRTDPCFFKVRILSVMRHISIILYKAKCLCYLVSIFNSSLQC